MHGAALTWTVIVVSPLARCGLFLIAGSYHQTTHFALVTVVLRPCPLACNYEQSVRIDSGQTRNYLFTGWDQLPIR
jgi:hypothetical protein